MAVSVIVVWKTSVEDSLTCLSLQSPVANNMHIINSLITLIGGLSNDWTHIRGKMYNLIPWNRKTKKGRNLTCWEFLIKYSELQWLLFPSLVRKVFVKHMLWVFDILFCQWYPKNPHCNLISHILSLISKMWTEALGDQIYSLLPKVSIILNCLSKDFRIWDRTGYIICQAQWQMTIRNPYSNLSDVLRWQQ